jgi:LysM repeat protein
MQMMKSKQFFGFGLFIIFSLCLNACQSSNVGQTPVIPAGEGLTPYFTATITPTATATAESLPTETPLPLPTSTPKIVTLKSGDTLWTIAAKAGLTIDQILAANPDVDAHSLKIGMKIIIPAADANITPSAPTPTPISVLINEPRCMPSLTGGLYCFASVENNQEFILQNLSAQFTLTNSDTGETQVQPALLPLNHLTEGSSLPMFAYFAPPVVENYHLQIQLTSAAQDNAASSTYLPVTISNTITDIATDGLSAKVAGSVTVNSKASRFWIAAVAYDGDGNITAVRQYDKKTDLAAGASAEYQLYIYSIAGKMTKVMVYGEATP